MPCASFKDPPHVPGGNRGGSPAARGRAQRHARRGSYKPKTPVSAPYYAPRVPEPGPCPCERGRRIGAAAADAKPEKDRAMLSETMSGSSYLTLEPWYGPEAAGMARGYPRACALGPGEVLVFRVLAAGVNNTDINTREGWYSAEVTGATGETADGVAAGGWAGRARLSPHPGRRPVRRGGGAGRRNLVYGPLHHRSARHLPHQWPAPPRDVPENPAGFEVALGSEYDGAFAEYCLLEETRSSRRDRRAALECRDRRPSPAPSAQGRRAFCDREAGVARGRRC